MPKVIIVFALSWLLLFLFPKTSLAVCDPAQYDQSRRYTVTGSVCRSPNDCVASTEGSGRNIARVTCWPPLPPATTTIQGSATACTNPPYNLRIRTEPPSPIRSGVNSIQLIFEGTIPSGTYQLRLRDTNSFPAARNVYAGNPGTSPIGNNLTITIDNSDNKLSGGDHEGTLEQWNERERRWDDYCGHITYTIGFNTRTCSIGYTPEAPTTIDPIYITVAGTPPGERTIYIQRSGLNSGTSVGTIQVRADGSGEHTIPAISSPFTGRVGLGFQAFSTVTIYCGLDLNVTAAPPGATPYTPPAHLPAGSSSAGVQCDPEPPIPTDDGSVSIMARGVHPGGEFRVDLDQNNIPGSQLSDSLGRVGLTLGSNLTAGRNYTATIYRVDNNNEHICTRPFTVMGIARSGFSSSLPGAHIGGGPHDFLPPTAKCSPAIPAGEPPDSGISTAIGCVPTTPIGLIKALLALLTAFFGGVAFLLMITGAFQMITSSGNPDTLKSGHDRFLNAIIGLLVIIFSTLLLKVVGVDILGLGPLLGIP